MPRSGVAESEYTLYTKGNETPPALFPTFSSSPFFRHIHPLGWELPDMVVGDSTDTAAGSSSYSAAGDKVYTLKFVLAGSPGVGKTRLASLFHKKHDDGGYPSVGMQFATRTLRCGQHSCVRAQVSRVVCVGSGYPPCLRRIMRRHAWLRAT